MFVPKIEKLIAIEAYATRSLGIGGIIRRSVEDFVVEELLVDGSKAMITPSVGSGVLGSSDVKSRYLLCVLVKRNWDMLAAVKVVADQLDIAVQRIAIAGIKDAKAVTAQHVTIEGTSFEDVQKVNAKDIELYPVGYVRNKLSAFYLLGNSFRIVISSINQTGSAINKRIGQTVEEIKLFGGVPNFFGHQRFGTTRPITHLVGKAIVKGDFRKAVMLFLAKPSPREHFASRKAREELRVTQDFKQAFCNFPRQLRYERFMLKRLAEKSDDYVGAFRRLPVKLQELFVQAYQSYLFNKFLSGRIVAGFRLDRAEVGDYVVNVERSGLPMTVMHKTVDANALNEINEKIKAGKMRTALPLVGFKQSTSQGAQGEIEKQILEKEGVSLENFKIEMLPELTTRGELRTAITPLNNFLLDEISRDTDNLAKYKAKLSFTLFRGSYATIVLRELMKPRSPIKAGF